MSDRQRHKGAETFLPFLQAVGRGEKLKRDLTQEEAREAMHLILSGQATAAQAGAFLIAQRVKGESTQEVVGFTLAAREHCHRISPAVPNLLDLGLPYDGKARTLQLAPVVALVVAAAGQPVVFHGARDVPTKRGVGPTEVLERLGVDIDRPPEAVAGDLERLGIGFLYAPRFAPAWVALLPIRHELGLRTVLNTVEKFLNPANASVLVAGFFHATYLERMRQALGALAPQGWIVQGVEGSIECPPGRATRVLPARPEAASLVMDSESLGLAGPGNIEAPADPALHAAVARAVLANEPGAARDTTLLTAGLLLFLAGRAHELAEGVHLAQQALARGKASALLEAWRRRTLQRPSPGRTSSVVRAGDGPRQTAPAPQGGR